eukprot:14093594-Alexandrium_andersonii.AAC.1
MCYADSPFVPSWPLPTAACDFLDFAGPRWGASAAHSNEASRARFQPPAGSPTPTGLADAAN